MRETLEWNILRSVIALHEDDYPVQDDDYHDEQFTQEQFRQKMIDFTHCFQNRVQKYKLLHYQKNF